MKKKIAKINSLAFTVATLAATKVYAATDINIGADVSQPAGAPTDLLTQIKVVTNTLLLIVGIAAVIMLIIGGIRYILSGGTSDAVKGAKDQILYAVIGIVVALLAFAIVNFVLGRFGG